MGFEAEFTEIGNSTDSMTDLIEISRKEDSNTSPGSARGKMVLWITLRLVIREGVWQIPPELVIGEILSQILQRSVIGMGVPRASVGGAEPSTTKRGTELRSMQLVTTQGHTR